GGPVGHDERDIGVVVQVLDDRPQLRSEGIHQDRGHIAQALSAAHPLPCAFCPLPFFRTRIHLRRRQHIMAARKKATKGRAKSARRGAARRSKKASRGPKKPAGLRLSLLAPSLTVDDVAKSMAWYCDIVGFKVTQRWENDGRLLGVELEAGDVAIYLSQEDGAKGPRIKGQGLRIYWYTKQNVDRIAEGIKARGGHLITEPKDEWGVRSFSLAHPTGFLITVSSEP